MGRWIALLALCAIAGLLAGKGSDLASAGTALPAFVQAASAHSGSATSLTVVPGSNVSAGDRLIVEVGVWS